MDLLAIVKQSARHARASPYREDIPGLALLCQRLHAALAPALETCQLEDVCGEEEAKHITSAFLWLMPCCEDSTVIADALNRMHVSGVLWCKLCFLALFEDESRSYTPQGLFPGHPRLHVVSKSVWHMTLSECCTLLLAIQHEWRALLQNCAEAACRGVLACAAAFGFFVHFRHKPELLDAPEHVDPCEASAGLCVLSKKATRSFITTLHGLLRSWVVHTSAQVLEVRDAAGAGSVGQGQASEAPTSRVGVALQKIRRVWAQRRGIVAEDAAWEALAKGLEPVSIGEPPRKGTAELAAVVDAAAALLEMHTESTQVHASALPALVSAVRFYYITPSATLYRALVLQEKVLPGQRLNYAFDYQHFDTGQLSQVHLCFCHALIVVILTCMLSWYFYARFLQVIGSSFRT